MSIAGKCAIAGVGASGFERRPEQSVISLIGTAMTNAIRDAGLEKEQIDGLIVQVGSPRGADYDTIAATLGIDAGFCSQTWGHGRFAATVITHAAMAVATGMATRVACVMGMKNSDLGRIGEANNPFHHEQFRENGGPHGEEGHLGMASPVAGAAMGFDIYCRRYGYDRELLAAIPMTLRCHAALDSEAVMRDAMTLQDYQNARMIVAPLRLLDCSPVGDGAICVIVTANGQAGDRAITITGAQGMRAGRDTFIFGPVGLGMAQQSMNRMTLAQARAQKVYDQAGLGPDRLDIVGLYDSFSPLPLYALEDFGFCDAGEALGWVQDGRIGLSGELPVNTNGGQLSHAQMNGWGQIRELVTQLRGEAGARQVDGCRRAMWATPAGDALILERG